MAVRYNADVYFRSYVKASIVIGSTIVIVIVHQHATLIGTLLIITTIITMIFNFRLGWLWLTYLWTCWMPGFSISSIGLLRMTRRQCSKPTSTSTYATTGSMGAFLRECGIAGREMVSKILVYFVCWFVSLFVSSDRSSLRHCVLLCIRSKPLFHILSIHACIYL